MCITGSENNRRGRGGWECVCSLRVRAHVYYSECCVYRGPCVYTVCVLMYEVSVCLPPV